MKYREDLTQEQNILELLKERGKKGVYVYELMTPRPNGLGIAQYNARILGLREKGHNIVNVEEGHFVLQEGTLVIEEKEETPNISKKIKHVEFQGNRAIVTWV